MRERNKEDLKPFGNVIQTCPECGRLDVYLNDGHSCKVARAAAANREMNDYNGWD
jgi:hypothetical protein